MSAHSVSIIIPCYNEEGNIAECIRRVPQVGSSTEVLVVNDGSKDRTKEVVSRLLGRYSHVRLISYEHNRGKAHAVAEGIRAATGDIVMILDADMTVRPEDVPHFYEHFLSKKVHLLMGTRFQRLFSNRAMPLVKQLSNRMAAGVFSVMLKTRITDTLCGTKVVWREDAKKIRFGACRWGDYDILRAAALRKWKVAELPIQYYERVSGESKMRLFPDGVMLYVRALALLGEVFWHDITTQHRS